MCFVYRHLYARGLHVRTYTHTHVYNTFPEVTDPIFPLNSCRLVSFICEKYTHTDTHTLSHRYMTRLSKSLIKILFLTHIKIISFFFVTFLFWYEKPPTDTHTHFYRDTWNEQAICLINIYNQNSWSIISRLNYVMYTQTCTFTYIYAGFWFFFSCLYISILNFAHKKLMCSYNFF